MLRNFGVTILVEVMSGALWKPLDFHPSALVWKPRRYMVNGFPDGNGRGTSLFEDSRLAPAIALGMDHMVVGPVCFDATGTQLGWGNPDGTATVYNLKQIHDRLSQAGLAWQTQTIKQ
jgi:hypothetical protein